MKHMFLFLRRLCCVNQAPKHSAEGLSKLAERSPASQRKSGRLTLKVSSGPEARPLG